MTCTLVNDVHSRLNETAVDGVVPVDSLESIGAALEEARDSGTPVSIAGGRHAMGGQQFCSGGILLDTRPSSRVLALDLERGIVEVEAGIQWPALIDALADSPWAIRQKQTGADDLCLGGAVSANVHGRGLTFGPFVDDLESLVVVGPDGAVRSCSRTENTELFRLAIGGYGLFGIVTRVELRLRPRVKVERVVELAETATIMQRFEQHAKRFPPNRTYLFGGNNIWLQHITSKQPPVDVEPRHICISCLRVRIGRRAGPDGIRPGQATSNAQSRPVRLVFVE